LTTRERQIADALTHGQTSKEIARALRISVRPVEKHRENIRQKNANT